MLYDHNSRVNGFLDNESALFASRHSEPWLTVFENSRNMCGWGQYLNRNAVPNNRRQMQTMEDFHNLHSSTSNARKIPSAGRGGRSMWHGQSEKSQGKKGPLETATRRCEAITETD